MDIENLANGPGAENMEEPLYRNQKNIINSTREFLGPTTYVFILTSIFLVLLQVYFKSLSKKKKGDAKEHDKAQENEKERLYGLNDIYGPKALVPFRIIGNLPELLPYKNALIKGLQWNRDYPGMGKIYAINQAFVGLHSGPLLQQLFKSTDFGHGVKSPLIYNTMKPFITNGVLVSTGKFWQTQRKTLMKSQSFQSLKAYMGMLNRHSKLFVHDLEKLFEDGKPHEINGAINVVFLKVISEMLTGFNDSLSTEFDQYHHNFSIWKESVVKRILNPWLLLKPLWKLDKMSKLHDKAVEEMIEFARRRIKEHKEKRAESTNLLDGQPPVENEKPKFRSVVDELIDAGVEENQIVDEVNTMLFGGHETGATSIHFLCFLLALHPEIQELCRMEIDELFGDPLLFQNGEITYEAAQSNLKYVERCILESLRLFPPVFLFLRQLKTPLKIEFQNKTFQLPVGTNVVCSPFVLHRDASVFPEPEKFDPDRFLPEEVAKRHVYSFVPFSGGPRMCLGLKFAMIEMKVMVAYLLRNFVMSTTDKMEDVPLLPFVTLTPAKDYTFEFQKRVV